MSLSRTPSSASDATATWLGLTACPDCGARLDPSEGTLVCPGCRRHFGKEGAAFNLLPSGTSVERDAAAPAQRELTRGGAARQSWRSKFVAGVYTRHNYSTNVVRAVRRVLSHLAADDWGLNLGSADTSLDGRLVNLDVRPSANVHVLGTADRLPFADETLACVISQEVFEHLPDPHRAVREVARVLRPGGLFYLQTPFVMGLHSLPHDYWRFTDRGLSELLTRAGLEVIEVEVAVGAGTAMYRIGVEFAATLAATVWRRLYFPVKGLAAVALWPLRWADCCTAKVVATNRIPAGFYAIGRKPIAPDRHPTLV